MVEKDQLVVDVCVTTRGYKTRMPKADLSIEKLQEKKVSPKKGC
jgi:hypothetical protein